MRQKMMREINAAYEQIQNPEKYQKLWVHQSTKSDE